MNDVPQSEERTTNAPKDSELPEVDTTKEIFRKRKKEEIALRFADPGSKELYLAGLEIKREGNLAWVIHEEKRMSWNRLKNECPVIIQNLKASRWACLVKPTGNYIPVIVREFYATYREILNSKRGRKEIESDDDFFLMYTDYDEMIKRPDDHRVWTTSVIAKETPDWIDTMVAIHKNTLKRSPRGPAPTKKTAPATFVTTSSAPDTGQGILAHEIVLAGPVLPPALQLFSTHFRVSTKPRVDHSTERDDMEDDQAVEDDDDNRSERQSDSELDIDKGDDPLASAHSTVKATNIPLDEVDTVVAM
ncbi:hypothetical protein K7X08_009967 [Anisodus acutangulus]|uniref:Uncharacterized protein n=1 Tax=Anisodus acutangulus TaxID=402998 RepID=A0A9Q1RUN6_9SOLA|nr:hypothetical protein K7X08_009967 [Anisodus acutangulus]